MRRAVLLGLKSVADFDAFLVAQNFTADAVAVLVAELQNDVAEADQARARRQAAESTTPTQSLPLSTLARAARLGVVSVDTYEQRLRALGYDDDDVDIEVELLLIELAEVQAKRAARDAEHAAAAAGGLTLAEVLRAVRFGVESPETYRAKLFELGRNSETVDTLMSVLYEELAQADDAKRRRATLGSEPGERALALTQLEDLVKGGFLTIDDFLARAIALRYAPDDAELLAALLQTEIDAKAAKSGA